MEELCVRLERREARTESDSDIGQLSLENVSKRRLCLVLCLKPLEEDSADRRLFNASG